MPCLTLQSVQAQDSERLTESRHESARVSILFVNLMPGGTEWMRLANGSIPTGSSSSAAEKGFLISFRHHVPNEYSRQVPLAPDLIWITGITRLLAARLKEQWRSSRGFMTNSGLLPHLSERRAVQRSPRDRRSPLCSGKNLSPLPLRPHCVWPVMAEVALKSELEALRRQRSSACCCRVQDLLRGSPHP